MKFLNNTNTATCSELPVLTRAQLFKFIKEEWSKLLKLTDEPVVSKDNSNASQQDTTELTLEQELEFAIHEFSDASIPANELLDMSKVLHKELTLFELNGKLTENLQRLFNGLKTVQPTSTESERVFSSSSNICNKTRSRLSDYNLHILCFLKSYFKRIDG